MPKTIHSDDYAVLIRLLRELRRSAAMRQVDLAAALGRPQSFVSKYESGERRLDVLELRQVCLALGSGLPQFVKSLELSLDARS